jgi:hypothetical protein
MLKKVQTALFAEVSSAGMGDWQAAKTLSVPFFGILLRDSV